MADSKKLQADLKADLTNNKDYLDLAADLGIDLDKAGRIVRYTEAKDEEEFIPRQRRAFGFGLLTGAVATVAVGGIAYGVSQWRKKAKEEREVEEAKRMKDMAERLGLIRPEDGGPAVIETTAEEAPAEAFEAAEETPDSSAENL
jgi:hypothetical protein